MPEIHVIGIGEFRTSSAPDRLISYGLGSCVAIALYDPATCRGALSHSLLPHLPPGSGTGQSAKYVETAVELMLEGLLESGCDSSGLVAKLAGGATMFEELYRTGEPGIGERNIAAARDALLRHSVPLVAEEVGGTTGRSISFDLSNGLITIRSLYRTDLTL